MSGNKSEIRSFSSLIICKLTLYKSEKLIVLTTDLKEHKVVFTVRSEV